MVRIGIADVFTLFLKLTVLGGLALYSGRVLMRYFSGASLVRPEFDRHNPAVAAEQWAEWLGVKAVGVGVRGLIQLLAILSEASAEVGEWFLEHRHHETH